jgi:WD40 repeat protein
VTRFEAGDVTSVHPSPDGTHVITSGAGGSLVERDASSFQPTGRLFVADGGDGGVADAVFSDDGRWMLSLGNARAQLWDYETGQRVGDVFPSGEGWDASVTNSFNTLVTGLDRHPVLWDLDTDSWPLTACAAAGRNMTAAEWTQYGPKGVPYHATCPQYPSLESTSEETS